MHIHVIGFGVCENVITAYSVQCTCIRALSARGLTRSLSPHYWGAVLAALPLPPSACTCTCTVVAMIYYMYYMY